MGSGDIAEELIDSLDDDALDDLFDGLTEDQLSLFGGRDVISVLKGLLSGNAGLDFSDVMSFVLGAIGSSLAALVALFAVTFGVAVVCSATDALSGGRHSESVGKAVRIACLVCVLAVAGTGMTAMFTTCAETLEALGAQMNVLLPPVLTVMAGTGGAGSAAVFSPVIAVITGGLFNLITSVLVPMLVAAFVFGAVGCVTGGNGMDKMSSFMHDSVKWMFGIGFFLLTAVMSVQGVTASVTDNLGVRGAKFAIGKYVPVIGGYMSEGFNLIVSGGIAVKNALGYTALVLLLAKLLPVVLQIAVFSLCLKLSAAVTEALGDKRMGDMLAGMSKTVTLTGGVMFGAGFLYFVFVLILMATGRVFL